MSTPMDRTPLDPATRVTPAPAAGGETPPWSAAAMVERLGGDQDLARQLVILFLEEYPRLLGGLRVSLASRDADAIRRAAHAAKGCIANFIEAGPRATASQIEQAALRGDLGSVPALAARLEDEVARLAAEMRAFAQETQCAS